MRALKWIFGTLAQLLGTVLFLVALTLAALWWRPELLLNEGRVRQALRYAPAGTEVSWNRFEWRFHGEGWLGKRMELHLGGLCFRQGESLRGCLDALSLDLSFSLSGLRPRITRLGELRLLAGEIHLRSDPKAPEPPMQSPLPDLRFPALADLYPADLAPERVGPIEIAAPSVTVTSADGGAPLRAELGLRKEGASEGVLRFALSLRASQGKAMRAAIGGTATLEPRVPRLSWNGRTEGAAGGWRWESPLKAAWERELRLDARPLARTGKKRIETPLELRWGQKGIELGLGTLVLDQWFPRQKFRLDRCRLESELAKGTGHPTQNGLRCDATVQTLREPVLPPYHFSLAAGARLEARSKTALAADLSFEESGRSEYLESRVQARAALELDRRRNELVGTPQPSLSARFAIPDFAAWRRALDRTPLAVPAPLRTLNGPGEFRLELTDAGSERLLFRANLRSDFRGGQSSLVTDSKAEIEVRHPWRGPRAVKVNAEAVLADVRLEAPPLELESPPQFLPDSRFFASRAALAEKQSTAPAPAANATPVEWNLTVRTQQPVRIRTNLLEPEFPVALNLQMSDRVAMSGEVALQPMPLEVFKKKADLKFVKVTYHGNSSVGELNGLLVHRNPEVQIRILLLGSTEKPRVEFESDPPLNRQQIVAVLLFNKSVSELTEDEASSAASMSQATADGALGLFSLLFLSSTPIESVAYDPVTKTYSARLRLGNKTTLAVGSDFDQERQFALRRRLGGRWSMRTEFHEQENRPDVLLTLLEWFQRF